MEIRHFFCTESDGNKVVKQNCTHIQLQKLNMTSLLSLKDSCPTKCNLKTNLRQLFLPSFKNTMKSTIIKAVTQTQFETCVTAFIALLLNDGGKSCLKLVLRLYLIGQLSFNDSNF